MNKIKTVYMKRTIKLTEQELHNIIKESVKTILEYNYKSKDKKIKVAQYLKGKKGEQMRDEWSDIIAKRTAIRDINKDKNIFTTKPSEFDHAINSETFDINFNDVYDNIYDDVI
jgi:hypothetical protein